MSKTYETPVIEEYGTVSSRTERDEKIGSAMDSEVTTTSDIILSGDVESD
ncbi:hypothetical protein ACOZ4L_09290 [Haloplanus ruber]|uniref:Lasso RiPP family leader peptide-containing protein n=1 Tax=Haloplanus ruber TaxID=869892 RepID=A0ABD6CWE8_9EURY|nr:hypothetical protein [Haloplanus ruber]